MMQLRKSIARLVLHAISLFGIVLGFAVVCAAIALIAGTEWDNIALVCASLGVSAAALALGAYLIYTSFLMFRRRAFGVIRLIPWLLALAIFGAVMQPVRSFAATSSSGRPARHVESLGVLALFIGLYLLASICSKLLERVLKAAYGPDELIPKDGSRDP